MRRSVPLLVVICVPFVLSCGADEPACETREVGLAEQRWVLECGTERSIPEANPVASYFDPEWTARLPSSVHIYCSDRGPTFAWSPGVRTSDDPRRWRDKAVYYRVDGGSRVQGRWMVRTDARGRPTYYLYGARAATLVETLREARELLLETQLDQDEEPTLRLVTLEGLPALLERFPCYAED